MKPLFLVLLSSSLVTAVITASSALTLAPTLLRHLAGLEDALEGLRTEQIVLAAVRMRSLVPEYTVKVEREVSSDDEAEKKKKTVSAKVSTKVSAQDSDDSSDSDNSDNSDSDDFVVPNHQSILINSLNTLLKSLPSASKDEAMHQIFAFDFSGPKSITAFLAEKEGEAAQKLAESIATIRSIQRSLQSNPNSSVPVTVALIARVVATLDSLEDAYEELEVLQQKPSKPSKHSKTSSKQSKASSPAKQQRATAKLTESRAKIAKIVLKLAGILDE